MINNFTHKKLILYFEVYLKYILILKINLIQYLTLKMFDGAHKVKSHFSKEIQRASIFSIFFNCDVKGCVSYVYISFMCTAREREWQMIEVHSMLRYLSLRKFTGANNKTESEL